jgi:hypothetical protein
MLPEEDAAAFEALEAALFEELAPVGALQSLLARRIPVAAWRLERAERLEVEVFEHRRDGNAGAGLALIRDGNGTRSFDALLRYRGAAMAELMRSLRALKALQAEQKATPVRAAAPAPVLAFEPKRTRGSTLAPHEGAPQGAAREKNPNQPEACSGPRDPAPAGPPWPGPEPLPSGPGHARPKEPEARDPRASEVAAQRRNPSGTRATRAGGAR